MQPAPILLVSLFNGIGGCFRAYDIAGLLPKGRIAVEINEDANRITARHCLVHCKSRTFTLSRVALSENGVLAFYR